MAARSTRGPAGAVVLGVHLMGLWAALHSTGPAAPTAPPPRGLNDGLVLVRVALPPLPREQVRAPAPSPARKKVAAQIDTPVRSDVGPPPAARVDASLEAATDAGRSAAQPAAEATSQAAAAPAPQRVSTAVARLDTAAPPPAPAPVLTQAHADRRDCPGAPHPAALRDRGIEGVVHLLVRVNSEGRPAEVRLQQASGWRLFDEAALAQARNCRFVPARRGSDTVESWVEFPVRFALKG